MGDSVLGFFFQPQRSTITIGHGGGHLDGRGRARLDGRGRDRLEARGHVDGRGRLDSRGRLDGGLCGITESRV